MKVLAVTVAFSAVLFVVIARPQGDEDGGSGDGGSQNNTACEQYEQCMQGQSGLSPIQEGVGGGLGGLPGLGPQLNSSQGQLPNCEQLKEACEQGGQNGLSPPPNSGISPPPNPEVPGGGMDNMTGQLPVAPPGSKYMY